MNVKKTAIGGLIAISIFVLTACGQTVNDGGPDKLTVTVSISPQKYFVERIGGDLVDVNVMVEPGVSPHTYEPKPEQLRALSRSAAYFRIRVEFERAWMDRIVSANPDMLIVDTTEGIERMSITAHEHHEGEEEEEEEAHHEEAENPDPHVWLSPALVKVQAETIAETLIELDPEHESIYRENYETFVADIEELEREIGSTLDGIEKRSFMVFHPSWGYFARDFDLEMIPIEVGGQEPSAAELAALIEEAEEEDVKVVFAQPEFRTRDAETIAEEIGGEVLLISPLAEDWLDNMRRVADTFASALDE